MDWLWVCIKGMNEEFRELTELDFGERVGKFIVTEQGGWKVHRRDGGARDSCR